MTDTRLHLIYTRYEMLVTSQEYGTWRQIQDEYPDYVASLGPWNVEEMVEYLSDEYPKLCPDAQSQITSFLASGQQVVSLIFKK